MKNLMILTIALMMSQCGPYKVSENKNPLQEKERITALDLVLKNLNVVKLESQKQEDGRLKVLLSMQNEKNKDLWADIQVVFRDDKGTELERTSWEAVQFHRRDVSSYERTSLNQKATDYRVVIRNTK